jgi:hypothetical protein
MYHEKITVSFILKNDILKCNEMKMKNGNEIKMFTFFLRIPVQNRG